MRRERVKTTRLKIILENMLKDVITLYVFYMEIYLHDENEMESIKVNLNVCYDGNKIKFMNSFDS
jgi:hypothetical protein